MKERGVCFFSFFMISSTPGYGQNLSLLSATGDLLPTMLLLIVVIFVSSAFRKSPESEESARTGISAYTDDLFQFSDFPTAVFDLDLKLMGANQNFSKIFQISADSGFNPLTDSRLVKSPGLITLLKTIKTSHKIPDAPVFLDSESGLTEQNENSSLVSGNYFMVRKVVSTQTQEQLVVLLVIESKYSKAFATDLTRKIAQRDIDLKKLEELDQLKSEFLATLSHELKTPLVSIKGYLDLMASEKMGPLTEKQEKALRVSLKNTSHLNTLISSILNFARMEAGKLLFDLVNQKLPPHVNDIIDSLKPIADNRQITIITDFSESLPIVIIDPELIHRVLINLLENAIKFSPPGSQVTVSITRHSESLVRVEVKDQGRGIPHEKLDKIKAPFYQADKSDTRPTGGLGLGLAIAEKILIGHGTSLQIESQENVGTVCSFFLKVAPPKL